jgi:hypothetical protein
MPHEPFRLMTHNSRLKFSLAAGWLPFFLWLLLWAPVLTQAATDSAAASFTPWSGYWWPSSVGGLATGNDYRGHPAPLEKYELLKNGTYPGFATQWDLEHHYDPDAMSWYGLCAAWAAASAYEEIRFYPSVIENILFRVGDKKGLITACHDNDVSIRINAETPDIFHYWLLHYIKDQGISFYAELDPSIQVWNYPITRYEMTTIEKNGGKNVTCQIWFADDMVDPDIQGTVELTKLYTYDLVTAGDEITGGEWTGASVYNHPQKLVLPVSPGSNNPYLDYPFIRNIALLRDDELESDQPTELTPGGYNLILLNEDTYRIFCNEGDTIILHMDTIDNSDEEITVLLRDQSGNTVFSCALDGPKDASITAENPPYTLSFSENNYANGGVYHLDYDLKKTFEFANMKIQKGFGWGGFAITNTGETQCDRISVVGYGKDGLPTETYAGPFSLVPGEKRIVMTSDFNVRAIDRDDFTGVKIMASEDLGVVNLFGYFQKNMSCYGEMKRNTRFVIPDFSTWSDSRSVSWGMYNPGVEEKTANLKLFSLEGYLLDSADIVLGMNRAVHYSPSVSPFSGEEGGGWILVADDGTAPLQGYSEWLEDGISKAEALGALGTGREFFVSHVVDTSFWNQSITLINVSNRINPVTMTLVDGSALDISDVILNPYEKKIMTIAELFPYVDSEALNRSGMVIEAEQDIAGFFRFETPGDDMYYSLLDETDILQELVVPHVASNDYWWTGLTLFNSSYEAVEFSILPYDADGHLMAEHTLYRSIEAKTKDVFTVSDLFGDQASGISFIKFKVSNGPGLVGVFGYGNSDCSMLSGSVMR